MSWLSDLTGIDIDFNDLSNSQGFTDKDRAYSTLGFGASMLGLLDRDSSSNMLGYQGQVPELVAQRSRVPNTYDPTRRPGSGGQRYFTGTQYIPKADYVAPEPETTAGLAALNAANPARQTRPLPVVPAQKETTTAAQGASSVIDQLPVPTYDAQGNTVGMAAGGIAALKKGKYLNGATDGMADKIPANIDGVQEAALSDGEFVIPADVVSHLGNGNSDAGAKVLTKMMARVRKVRTGNDKQGKEIDPKKFLPA